MILRNDTDRAKCLHHISMLNLEKPQEVTIKPYSETRTDEQSAKMYAMLDDISRQVKWHGKYYNRYQWKDLFTAALKGQETAPGIEGGIVSFGTRTSKMTIPEMSEMIEYLFWFGAEHEVVWSDPKYKTYQAWSDYINRK